MEGQGVAEASAPDYNLLPSSGNQLPQEPQLSHESQLPQEPMSPQQTESDKTDNIVGPNRGDEAPARDENTSQDQGEADLAASQTPEPPETSETPETPEPAPPSEVAAS